VGITSGVYEIVNITNNHRYVGSSKVVNERWKCHTRSLINGKHHSQYLQRAWNLYGQTAFSFSIIEECPVDLLVEREQYFIDYLRPEYNICPRAYSSEGRTMSDESRKKVSEHSKSGTPEVRAKISAARIGMKMSPETRAKMSAINKGRVYSQEAKLNMSKVQKGHSVSLKTRQKISIIGKGRVVTDKTRRAISIVNIGNKSRLGLKNSPEMRAKISKSLKNRLFTDETRANLSKAMIGNKNCLGRTMSPETRKKISDAAIKRYAELKK
jgi:group I intron endonuclease